MGKHVIFRLDMREKNLAGEIKAKTRGADVGIFSGQNSFAIFSCLSFGKALDEIMFSFNLCQCTWRSVMKTSLHLSHFLQLIDFLAHQQYACTIFQMY